MPKNIWVSPDQGNWKVQWEKGDFISIHFTKEIALSAAKAQVRSFPKGEVTSIIVQDADGEIRTEWTYGKDPYPPVG
jgi:hypothetical protein